MSTTTTDTQPQSRDFDFRQAECILPARTSAFAYVDQRGDLRIWAQDSACQCDSELRIPAEDIDDFLNGLAELVGREPLLEPRSEPDAEDAPPQKENADPRFLSRPLSSAERVRRHREKKRNGCNEGNDTCNDENVTGNAPALLELGGDE